MSGFEGVSDSFFDDIEAEVKERTEASISDSLSSTSRAGFDTEAIESLHRMQIVGELELLNDVTVDSVSRLESSDSQVVNGVYTTEDKPEGWSPLDDLPESSQDELMDPGKKAIDNLRAGYGSSAPDTEDGEMPVIGLPNYLKGAGTEGEER